MEIIAGVVSVFFSIFKQTVGRIYKFAGIKPSDPKGNYP